MRLVIEMVIGDRADEVDFLATNTRRRYDRVRRAPLDGKSIRMYRYASSEAARAISVTP